MTVSELREFLDKIWRHLHNDKNVGHIREELDPTKESQDAQIDKIHGPGAAEALEKAIADGSVFSESSRDPGETPQTVQTQNNGKKD
jgi:hypothetical protein